MPSRKRLNVEQIGDETHVRFADPRILDKPNIEQIADELFHLVDVLGRRRMRIDFANIEYLSSAALGKLLALQKKLQADGGTLTLCNVSPSIFKVFEVSKLDEFFDIQRAGKAAE